MKNWRIKYAPHDTVAGRNQAINRELQALCMLEMTIDHMTGKEAIELVRMRKDGTSIQN